MVRTGVTYSPGRPHACWALELLGFGGEKKKGKEMACSGMNKMTCFFLISCFLLFICLVYLIQIQTSYYVKILLNFVGF
jgi:hypothetical protein